MSTLNEYFDRILCINLDRRVDRWTKCLEEFEKHDLDVLRIQAVDGKDIPKAGKIRGPEIGCILSHKAALQMIVRNGWGKVLILEDDIEFIEDLNNRFEIAIAHVPKWDMLYFGGNHVNKVTKINEFVGKCNRTFTTSHYCVTLKSAGEIEPQINAVAQIDVTYSRLQKEMQMYAFVPPLAWQVSGYSDIQGGETNYDFMKK